jgi:phosphohistidine swiveling domain-containing protein
MASSAEKYGLLIEGFDVVLVNGFWYQRLIPFGSPKGDSRPPPSLATWLATRLHPVIVKRIRKSRRAFADKYWRDELTFWDDVEKPRALVAHELLLGTEPQNLDDKALVEHLGACNAHLEAMAYLHQRYVVACFAPIGDLLAHVREWTDCEACGVLGATRGSSAISLGFAAHELQALAAAIRADASLRAWLVKERDERETLAALLDSKSKVGELALRFMHLVRYRAMAYDVGEPLVGEVPEMIVRCILSAVDGHFKPAGDDGDAWAQRIRETIPTKYHSEFDELVVEARAMSRLRDERGMYTDCFAIGIARRALLEAGKRLVARGLLHRREHAVDLTMSELEALFSSNRRGPSAVAVEERVLWRTTMTANECPRYLGPAPSAPPRPALLPTAARRPARAVAAVMAGLFAETDASSARDVIRGLRVNAGVYEGVARKVEGPSEFGRIRRGDVLVTRSTAPYFNVILPLLGAIVTDRGGQLCHAAIVAREYGIPGVVGTTNATALIPDGARVRVDGIRAEVTILRSS